MSKKKRKGPRGPGDSPGHEEGEGGELKLPRPPERLVSPFKEGLAGLKKQLEEQEKQAAAKKKAPPAPVPPTKRMKSSASEDAMALSLAMQGVKPLEAKGPGRVSATPKVESRTARLAPFGTSAEEQARARLDALVAQDVRFRVEREGDSFVSGVRIDANQRIARELRRRTRCQETLDLHGMGQRESSEAVTSFVRRCHRQGLDVLCIVHGKGVHSEDGKGVLRDVAVRALTESAAAPLVRAFVTAPELLGGSGALLVELMH